VRFSDAPKQCSAADVRQIQIENQQVIAVGVDEALGLAPIACEIHRKALRAQPAGNELRQFAVILDNQQPHGSPPP
jgi:hypothetical protein